MKGLNLYLSMMRRRWLGNSLIALLIAVTSVFMLLYPGLIADSEEELEAAYKSIEVSGWLVNASGYDDPQIPLDIYDAIVDSGFLKEYYAYSYCPVMPVDVAIREQCNADPTFVDYSYEKQCEQITGPLLKKLEWGSYSTINMYGVNDLYADSLLSRLSESITWLDGYDADALRGEEMVCIVPEDSGVALGDEVQMILRRLWPEGTYKSGDKARVVAAFKVIGTHTLTSGIQYGSIYGSNYYAYCPLAAMRRALEGDKTFNFTVRNLSFTIGQCDRIDEFKQLLVDLQLNVNTTGVRAAVDDRIMIGTVSPIQKNIALLKGLHVFLYALVVLMGFLLCFLTARGRKQEYAVMRLLGESRAAVTMKAIVEQIILCAIGIGLGIVAMLIIPYKRADWFSADAVILVAACYLVGAASAALMSVRVDVMSILRDKE